MTHTQALQYAETAMAQHLACVPVGMQAEALAHELAVVIGPELMGAGCAASLADQ